MGKTIRISGFPCKVHPDHVKTFLELYTGKGSIFRLRVWEYNRNGPNQTSCATVQFTTSESADKMVEIIHRCLNYGSNLLQAHKVERDFVPEPRTSMLTLYATDMHFGCQTSSNSFQVHEKVSNVVVNFGYDELRTIQFLLQYCDVEYALELSYDNIWQIHESSNLQNHNTKFLVFQLLATPKIYKNLSSRDVNEDLTSNYYKDARDDKWIRTTDFTESSCIGQSSGLCLEIQRSSNLDCMERFHFYKRRNSAFFLANDGATCSSLHGPVIHPPVEINLPYEILFKVNSLVQIGLLARPTLNATFFSLVHPKNFPICLIECALEKMYHMRGCCYDPVRWLYEQYRNFESNKSPARLHTSLDDGLVYIRRVQVTPTKLYFLGPEVNVSNRVLRSFPGHTDNFIRVSFVDENGERLRRSDLFARTQSTEGTQYTALYERVLSTLRNGIVVGGKQFDFLAFSSSQLRRNALWMFASRNGVTASRIRESMGNFRHIRNVAKYTARLGQSFSSSIETLNVCRHEVQHISDVEIEQNGNRYIFSDGIGKISSKFAIEVAEKCGIVGPTPSAFQIRYAGYKGVVAVDPTSVVKLSLRGSMSKYPSCNTKLDVLSWSKFQPLFLNRQIITLLSTLGVSDAVFEKKQQETVFQLDTMLTDSEVAADVLEAMAPSESVSILKEMLYHDYKPDKELFLSNMLHTFRWLMLHDIRNRARIFVSQGRSMMGCLDETGILEYGQVFVQVTCGSNNNYFHKGNIVVAKNPCLYPGDIRVLHAVDHPALHHLVDCVVFPQKGLRPHPNECSGSDLDGDVYFVAWDPELIPPRQVSPMDYSPAPALVLDHDVKIEEVQEYFANYVTNDWLGVIANAHTAFADKEPAMAESRPCVELAKLFSIAVDYSKTGVPAVIPTHLRVKEYPDFMEKHDKPSYESHRILGKLFREVKDIAPRTMSECPYDTDMEVDGFEEFLGDAQLYKEIYDYKLKNLMDHYEINTEAEILCGSIMKLESSFSSRKDMEGIGSAVRSLKKEARSWFDKKVNGEDNVYAKASAWYHVTYHLDYCGADRTRFLSFPWCVYDKLFHIKKRKSAETYR